MCAAYLIIWLLLFILVVGIALYHEPTLLVCVGSCTSADADPTTGDPVGVGQSQCLKRIGSYTIIYATDYAAPSSVSEHRRLPPRGTRAASTAVITATSL